MREVWEELAGCGLPVVLYGMGNGADKVLAVFEERGIRASGVFASDGFARGNLFHGFPVRTYADTCREFGDFAVCVAFASARPEVIANVQRIAAERRLFIPDLPVAGGGLFDNAFMTANAAELRAARGLLCDARSREVFDLVCEARITGDPDALWASSDDGAEDGFGLIRASEYRSYADVGAYTGDTVRSLMRIAPRLERVWAIEPDRRSFAKLNAALAGLPFEARAINAAAYDSDGAVLAFSDGEGRGSAVGKSGTAVTSVTLDTALGGAGVDYVKYDVEGMEEAALRGSRRTLERCGPDLRVAVYHRPGDVFALTLAVHEMLPRHSLYLRRAKSFPAWDLDLFAVKR